MTRLAHDAQDAAVDPLDPLSGLADPDLRSAWAMEKISFLAFVIVRPSRSPMPGTLTSFWRNRRKPSKSRPASVG